MLAFNYGLSNEISIYLLKHKIKERTLAVIENLLAFNSKKEQSDKSIPNHTGLNIMAL